MHHIPTRPEIERHGQATIVINRRRFLQDSLGAIAGLSVVPIAAAQGEVFGQGAPVSFDLHAHPGAFYARGQPGYAGDAAVVKTVTGMRDANVTGAFFSLVADAPLLERTPTGIVPRGSYGAGDAEREYRRQLSILRELLPMTPAFLATRSSDLLRAQRERKVAAFLACEGGEFLDGKPERIDQLYTDGVRCLQLVHYVPSALGDLQTQPPQHGGLSPLGKAVVTRATAAGMVIDVAHAAFDTVRDVASQTSAPLILSHSILKIDDSRPLAARAISEEHARLVAKTGGVIGAWPSGFNASFAEFIDNTKRLIDLVGIDHVGLGTDMDSNFKPVLSAYAQVRDWADGLQTTGFTRAEVAKVLGGNMHRVLTQVVG
jgi:membrane dipeptidase